MPFFSPDGRWIGFYAEGKLKKVLATGGGLQTLCDASAELGGTWGTNDSIYFVPFNSSGIWQVAASGGSPRQVTRLDRTQGEVSHRWPQISPDEKVVFFTVWTGPGWDEKHLEAQLTNREMEIIQLIEREYSNRRIAEALFISERTVETHRKNIFRKTGTGTILGLIKYAYHNNLIPGKKDHG